MRADDHQLDGINKAIAELREQIKQDCFYNGSYQTQHAIYKELETYFDACIDQLDYSTARTVSAIKSAVLAGVMDIGEEVRSKHGV